MSMQPQAIAPFIDHTALKADTTAQEVIKLCEEARTYNFCSVCINSAYIPLAKQHLAGSAVKICTVVGFPLGASLAEVKAFEAKEAIRHGAEEVDMVINIGELKSNNWEAVREDIRQVREATQGKLLKVILENCLLTSEEIVRACEICCELGADFVKTSTGFSKWGATLDDVALMRQTVGNRAGVKASGGIRDTETALAMLEAGANRIGASASLAIIQAQASVASDY